jgi:hypothetical protein
MAEVAAHLVDQVFPALPVRQWVLSVLKRLRYFLQRDPEALSAVLHILLRVIEAALRERSRCASGRLGAVSFVQRFGSALNAHVHFHCCVIDGVFAAGEDGQVYFHEAATLTPEDLATVQQQVRTRVLRWFTRAGPLDPADARAHKHVAEMHAHGLLDRIPVFAPSVGYFKRGMLVSVPLHTGSLPRRVSGAALNAIYAEHFAGEPFITVRPLNDTAALRDGAFLEPEALNGTNRLEVFVFANDTDGQALLVARLDNLGKGASGAAVQSINLMLGLPEGAGLS